MINYWIFVMTEYSNYNFGSIKETLNKLIKENTWKIGLRTTHRQNLKKNDKSVFYVSGNNRMYFIASAVIDSEFIYEGDPIYGYINLRKMNLFNKPIFIKSILDKLNFIKNRKYWGLHFQNGIIPINEKDYNKIIYA